MFFPSTDWISIVYQLILLFDQCLVILTSNTRNKGMLEIFPTLPLLQHLIFLAILFYICTKYRGGCWILINWRFFSSYHSTAEAVTESSSYWSIMHSQFIVIYHTKLQLMFFFPFLCSSIYVYKLHYKNKVPYCCNIDDLFCLLYSSGGFSIGHY